MRSTALIIAAFALLNFSQAAPATVSNNALTAAHATLDDRNTTRFRNSVQMGKRFYRRKEGGVEGNEKGSGNGSGSSVDAFSGGDLFPLDGATAGLGGVGTLTKGPLQAWDLTALGELANGIRGDGPLGGELDDIRTLDRVDGIAELEGITKATDLNSVSGVTELVGDLDTVSGVAGKLDGVTQDAGGVEHVTDVAKVGNVGKVDDAATLKPSSNAL